MLTTKESELSLIESVHQSGEFKASPTATEVLAPKTQTVVHSSKLLDECHLVDERSTAVIADYFLHRLLPNECDYVLGFYACWLLRDH